MFWVFVTTFFYIYVLKYSLADSIIREDKAALFWIISSAFSMLKPLLTELQTIASQQEKYETHRA